MWINIINYLGTHTQANKQGTTIREKREDVVRRQLEDLRDYWKNIQVRVWTQHDDWTPPTWIHDHRVIPQQSPAQARNLVLKELYASNDDWCGIWDNDATLYLHDDKDRLDTPYITQYPDDFTDGVTGRIAHWVPYNAQQSPYKCLQRSPTDNRWRQIYLENIRYVPTKHPKGTMQFITNCQKIYGQSIYHDESLAVLEDLDFGVRLVKAGLKIAVCENIFLREIPNKSTIFLTKPTLTPYKNPGAKASEGKWDWTSSQDRLDKYAEAKHQIYQGLVEKDFWQQHKNSWDGVILVPKRAEFQQKDAIFHSLFE